MFSIVNRNALKQPTNNQNQMQMHMQNRRTPILNFQQPQKSQKPAAYSPSDGDKIRWGRPTWRFFHTVAYKIKPEYFKQVRKDLLDIIFSICATLPCPICSEHAKQYMNSLNFNAIQTKEDLKDMLFAFHNSVNERKNYKPMDRSELDSTYANFDTAMVAREFMYYYKDRHRSMKLLADDMLRSRLAVNIQNWFNDFYKYCEP